MGPTRAGGQSRTSGRPVTRSTGRLPQDRESTELPGQSPKTYTVPRGTRPFASANWGLRPVFGSHNPGRGTPLTKTSPLSVTRTMSPVWKSKFYGTFVLNLRVVLHAIDAIIQHERAVKI